MQTDSINHGIEAGYAFDNRQLSVYVIETRGLPLLAFEANNRSQAEEIVRSHKLMKAIDRFCAAKCTAILDHYTLRNATDTEAFLYDNVATEFANPSNRLLFAYLPGFSA